MTSLDLNSLLGPVRDAALDVGRIVRRNFRQPMQVQKKGRIDLVTETDTAVEDELKRMLANILPEAGFLAEETASHTRLHGPTWIIDPVDGTTNFAHGLPFVATSVALWDAGGVQLGVVNLPLLDECFTAVRGQGAQANGEPVSVRDCDELLAALVATGFPYDIRAYVDVVAAQLSSALVKSRGVRRCGAAAVDLAYLAAGRFDAFYEYALNPWDVA
ncbi:MAG: inositol monophosphatase family protein, partial [Desulfovibrionaceae bacterium]